MHWRLISAPTLATTLFLLQLLAPASAPAQTSACVFQTDPNAIAAFCDTFDHPLPNEGTRSGTLDGVVWGVSRATENDNPPQGVLYAWSATILDRCGTPVQVMPPNDVDICNGQLVESINDAGTVEVLALYPRQPFDIAGRTGTVVFDVGNDTEGLHAAWPAFYYTDQPVPAPGPSDGAPGLFNHPRNGFEFSIAGLCRGPYGCGGNLPPQPFNACVTVDDMLVTANYKTSSVRFDQTGCVLQPSRLGELNHFEVRMSEHRVEVWASDAGQPAVRQIAVADNIQMPLTRGLIWIEHWQYNASKFNTQRTHTFAWDNVGFDGPVLARDLGFDVLDNTLPGEGDGGLPGTNLGYFIPKDGGSLSIQIPNVSHVADATAALLEFTYWPRSEQTLTYAANGNPPLSAGWPFGSGEETVWGSQTLAIPVPLAHLQDGTNTFVLSTSDPGGVSIANIDLILVGAGGAISD